MSDEESQSGDVSPDVVVADRELGIGDMPNCLSLLCKIDNGLAHAYVKLDAKGMKLTTIGHLSKYEHLRYVNVSQNFVQDLAPLNALRSLLWLKANNNRADSARLAPLPYLQVLDMSHNKIASVMGIEHPLLEQLNLSFNEIPSCEGLDTATLPNLQTLQMRSNQLTNSAGLENFKNLKHLYLGANNITSLEGISTLASLELLHLRDNQIADLAEDFKDGSLQKLRYINLRANNISSFDEIKKLSVLPKLTELVLLDNPIVEEDDYRLETLVRVRRLGRLDKDPFDEDEREQAQEKYEEMLDAQKEEAEAADE